MTRRTLTLILILAALLTKPGSASAQQSPAAAGDSLPAAFPSPIYYEDNIPVVSGAPGAAVIYFQEPSLEGSREEGGRFLIKYRWRFRDNSGKESEGESGLLAAWIDGQVAFGKNVITAGPFELKWSFLDDHSGQIAFDPSMLTVQQVQRRRFEDVQLPDFGQGAPQVQHKLDLLQFIQPDAQYQDQHRKEAYRGQTSHYLSLPTRLETRLRYVDQSLVVATPAGIGVFVFQKGFEREGGGGRQYGTSYRYRAVAADGSVTPAAEGEAYEQYIGDQYNSEATRQQLEAGPVHIGWSRGGKDAGWLYFDPTWHAVWILSPEAGAKLVREDTPISELQKFRYGLRESKP